MWLDNADEDCCGLAQVVDSSFIFYCPPAISSGGCLGGDASCANSPQFHSIDFLSSYLAIPFTVNMY